VEIVPYLLQETPPPPLCPDFDFDLYPVEIMKVVEVFSSHVLISSNLSYRSIFSFKQILNCSSNAIAESLLLFCDHNYINV
jgi:hypothetical protein